MELKDFYPIISEKKIPLSAINISPRIYSIWKDVGIINSEKNKEKQECSDVKLKRKWVYLNVFDAIWLLIVKDLRKLNLDFGTIKELMTFLYELPDYNTLFKEITEEEFLRNLKNKFPKEMIDSLGENFSKQSFIDNLNNTIQDEQKPFLTNLNTLLFGVLIQKSAPSILINLDSEKSAFDFALILSNTRNEKFSEQLFEFYSKSFSTKTFINLPITPLVSQLFENEKLEIHCSNYGLYSPEESKLLKAIRNDECREIKIVKHQSGDITINTINEKNIRNESAKELRKILGLKQYDRVEISYRNDKHLVIKNIAKELMKHED
jgi:hypothetical protein